MRSDDIDNRGVRWRRRNFPKPVATPCTGTSAYTKPNAISDSDANTHTDAHANTHTERWDDGHHYVGGGVTQNAGRAGGDTCDLCEQRHAATRDGLRSAP